MKDTLKKTFYSKINLIVCSLCCILITYVKFAEDVQMNILAVYLKIFIAGYTCAFVGELIYKSINNKNKGEK